MTPDQIKQLSEFSDKVAQTVKDLEARWYGAAVKAAVEIPAIDPKKKGKLYWSRNRVSFKEGEDGQERFFSDLPQRLKLFLFPYMPSLMEALQNEVEASLRTAEGTVERTLKKLQPYLGNNDGAAPA